MKVAKIIAQISVNFNRVYEFKLTPKTVIYLYKSRAEHTAMEMSVDSGAPIKPNFGTKK